MPLPAPQPRVQRHTRNVVFRGYQREDRLWDIEGQLLDTKTKVFDIPGEGAWLPGQPIHDMTIRVTIDDAFVVHEIAVAMDGSPHAVCPQAQAPMQSMIGCTMGRGWRQAIERNLVGIQGCAHLRELLFNMATVAFQTLSQDLAKSVFNHPPAHLGKCIAWDFNGDLVKRDYPIFYSLNKGNNP
ncbi:DUF2889 domain-containing protein [Rhodoferax sp.]|uniref:DUF2889 domain-containing protein n=1 Tax=Rhodoferax sp. TaxID=50421 RepID=UPI0026224774|nr:DUF2889 domain-containing protein [Rhodoferax sp.]MDD2919657.1 DUF2889 domain-containing protein [Rhodoferax sp.]